MIESLMPVLSARTCPAKAQRAVLTRAAARMCNAERAGSEGFAGHAGFVHAS
ncbi:MAG TPA: hypothetical protein PKA16_11100 [Ottowia sp.]|uniref:hypothetical protein n=1 Tax=Ottowia sp. TaxID=1898956 RepID=UPI002D1171F4|nr:hypothetical protein [Ottowia sp.]HMN21925.1 hypothetical protein [Ottowia sp.]